MNSALRLLTEQETKVLESKKSPQPRNTDSDGSGDTNSLSQESNPDLRQQLSSHPGGGRKQVSRLNSEWEILEGLKGGQRYDKRPEPFSGYLHKRRKWPLKGWHKRYFVVDKGILVYGKNAADVGRGKVHGSVDIGLSVISTKIKRKRLDIDAEEFIYHLKAKQVEVFSEWVEQLKKQRLYRQHVLTYGARDVSSLLSNHSDTPNRSVTDGGRSPPLRLQWMFEAGPLQSISTELSHAQQALSQLASILDHMDTQTMTDTESYAADGLSPNVKKDRKKFGLRKKKSSKGSSVDLCLGGGAGAAPSPSRSSTSVQDQETGSPLSGGSGVGSPSPARPQSLPASDHLSLCGALSSGQSDSQLASDYLILAKHIYSSLKTVVCLVTAERERLKGEEAGGGSPCAAPGGGSVPGVSVAVVAALRATLNTALQQNTELRSRLASIHSQSDTAHLPQPNRSKTLQSSLSYSSSCVSGSEFYDAEDTLCDEATVVRPLVEADRSDEGVGCSAATASDGQGRRRPPSDTSSVAGSVSSDDGSVSSEASDLADSEYNPNHNLEAEASGPHNSTGRRSKLPCARPSTEGLSLWNLLTKNIGKDLSQVSMPVALNEPLNMLQRLCEELEYSELLDKAAQLTDEYERMTCIAAFAVSSYCSGYYRAGSKPFNPLLGETYECIREDKGFRFIAEQVSHHPPVSVCFAESKNFLFWQDARIKTKFWGKSMEFEPTGTVNVKLEGVNGSDHYVYNKVTTCVHNLFSGQRWVDQYGQLIIRSKDLTCKLTFVKASYWSAKRHEIHGTIVDEREGRVVRNLFGKWSEALYSGVAPSAQCVWRPGKMPEDHDLYYGFTRFALELNELSDEDRAVLPATDTRLRPDQRLLEEGDLEGAEAAKLAVETRQRERRKALEAAGLRHQPKWFRRTVNSDNQEVWVYTHQYWDTRSTPGFVNTSQEPIW